LTADPDADDVRRILSGESAAFERIVRRWQKPLVNLAWRSCRHRELAEDLVQEVFLKAFRALDRWRATSTFSTWLFAIAINHIRSRLRRTPTQVLGIEAAFAVPDPQGNAEPAVHADPSEAVRRAVVGLPPRYREPIVLYYFGGHDVNECARILAVPTGTLKARLSRARDLLARSLRPAPPSPERRNDESHG
jgi:RNA polymerase sigma-70 factor (ECF subfamily)